MGKVKKYEDSDKTKLSKTGAMDERGLKKVKKSKKDKKSKKKKHKRYSSSSSASDDEYRRKKEKKRNKSKEDSSRTNAQNVSNNLNRDEWMSLPSSFGTFTKSELNKDKNQEKLEKKQAEIYVPGQSNRELNPYWKGGGDGLPSATTKLNFLKPNFEQDKSHKNVYKRSDNWRKKSETSKDNICEQPDVNIISNKIEVEQSKNINAAILTDQQMNELAAKLVKAEILGNQTLIKELKEKLDGAREARKNQSATKDKSTDDIVLLTTTDSRGLSRPLPNPKAERDPYYGRKKKNNKVVAETHVGGKRTKYFADDDKHSLHNMFENERFNTTDDQNKQFAEIVAKNTNPNDDLEDIFTDKIRSRSDDHKLEEKAKNRAIREHKRITQTLNNCNKCLESDKMEKHFMIAMGEHVYLSLLPTEGLQKGHCCIVPIKHISCSTLLDEEVWAEIRDFCRALTKMFHAHSMDVVFFENAIFLNRRPHMVIQCIPGPSKDMELLPFYFKKAILECEGEWSHNKKLIDLKGKDLTKAVPRGLPYFWVDFGDNTGFAHVIEEQDRFPRYFAQEIIGGMLELEPSLWRHPRKQSAVIQKVNELAEWWKPFDITQK